MSFKIGNSAGSKVYIGNTEVTKAYIGTNVFFESIAYTYQYSAYTSYTTVTSCTNSTPACNESTWNQSNPPVEINCRCSFGSWSSYSNTSSATATSPACGHNVTQRQVQQRTRSCSQSSYSCNCTSYSCNCRDVTTCSTCYTYSYNWGTEQTSTQSTCPYNSNCGNSCSGGPSSCSASTYNQTQWSCLKNPGFFGSPTTYSVTTKSCGRMQSGSYSCNCSTTTSCSTCTSCQTCYSCSCSGYSGWSNVSSCSRASTCARTRDCQTRTRTGYLERRTRTCNRVVV